MRVNTCEWCGLQRGERTSGRAEADDGTPERISLPADALLCCIRPGREVTAKSVLVGRKNKCKIVIIITISHEVTPNYNINILIYFHLFSRIHGCYRAKRSYRRNDRKNGTFTCYKYYGLRYVRHLQRKNHLCSQNVNF